MTSFNKIQSILNTEVTVRKWEWQDHDWGNGPGSPSTQTSWFVNDEEPSVQRGSGMNDTSWSECTEEKEVLPQLGVVRRRIDCTLADLGLNEKSICKPLFPHYEEEWLAVVVNIGENLFSLEYICPIETNYCQKKAVLRAIGKKGLGYNEVAKEWKNICKGGKG